MIIDLGGGKTRRVRMFSDRGHELYTKSFKLSFQTQSEDLTDEDSTRSRPSIAGRPTRSVSVLCRTLTGRTSCASNINRICFIYLRSRR